MGVLFWPFYSFKNQVPFHFLHEALSSRKQCANRIFFFQPFLSAKNKKTEMQTERPFSRSQMHFFLNWLRLPRLIFSLPWNQFVFFFFFQTHLGQCLTALASPIFRFSSYRSFFLFSLLFLGVNRWKVPLRSKKPTHKSQLPTRHFLVGCYA